ncbi:MAG: cupin domain-containing protein [Zoogloea sp.]|nr:cupin domain-containing protein [Zoogloea sp.]
MIVEREAHGRLDLHTHPFEALALILAGEIRIDMDGESRLYRVGEVFHLAAAQPHSESYGADGVRYLAGRR